MLWMFCFSILKSHLEKNEKDVETETCNDQNQQRSRGNAGDRADVRFLTFIFSKKEKLFEFLVFSVEMLSLHFVQIGHISE